MFTVKDNVIILFNNRVQTMITVVDEVLHGVGLHAVITSGLEGSHSNESFHYQARALDFRIRNWPGDISIRAEIVKDIRAKLGPAYDVVIEGDHLHVEYDPD